MWRWYQKLHASKAALNEQALQIEQALQNEQALQQYEQALQVDNAETRRLVIETDYDRTNEN